MEKVFVTVFSEEELENLIMRCLYRYEKEKTSTALNEKSYTINQVAKRLGRSHATIKRLVEDGILKTTSDQRRIMATSINDYLMNNSKK